MPNILVFDDDPILRDKLADFLRDAECRVVATAYLSEAAEAVMGEQFDLILCDYWMAEIDGLAFFHIIKDLQKMAVKVLMAAYPTRTTPSDLEWAGIDHVIQRSAAFESLDTLKNSLASVWLSRKVATVH